MRITNNLLVERFLRMHQEIMESLEKASYKLSSGKRLEYPSDAPSDTSQIINLRRSIEEMERFLKNMDSADAWLGAADSAFDKMDRYLERVRELALTGANDSQNADSRDAIAHELDQIFEELVDIGNTKVMDKYIFAGTKTTDPPFEVAKKNRIKLGYIPQEIAPDIKIEVGDSFSDLYQFETGNYRIFLKREGTDGVAVWVENEEGRIVQIDSNGSDDSGRNHNVFADRAVIKPSVVNGKIYGTYDTGRGIVINFNGLDISKLDRLQVINLGYVRGGDIAYYGNDGEQQVQIGYDNRVTVNVPGEGLFKPSHRVLASQSYGDLPFYESMPMDRLNQFTGARFRIEGVGHSGEVAGAARVVAPRAVDFEGLGSSSGSLRLDFFVNEGGSLVSASVTISLPASYESMDKLVDVLKAQLDANDKLRDRVEVEAEGDHLVFYLINPGDNYLFVKEEGSDYLGFGSGLGSWGMDPHYTVSQRVWGNVYTYTPSDEVFKITAGTNSVEVTASATQVSHPLYTYERIAPRLFDEISAGTTVSVSVSGVGTFVWQAPSDIVTIDDLVESWNDPGNWSGPAGADLPPVAMVKEGDTDYRMVSLYDTGRITFAETSTSDHPALYLMGLSPDAESNVYVMQHEGYMKPGEYTALRLAYSINKAASSIGVSARTDGKGGIQLVSTSDRFRLELDPSGFLVNFFPNVRIDGGKAVAESEVDKLKDVINRVEELFRYHVKGYVKDGILYFKDVMGGKSLFELSISAADPGVRNIFSSFYVAKEGEGVDIFRIVKNLRDANAENIPRRSIGMPGDWKSVQEREVIKTTLLPMFDGEFAGNYNTTWNVKVDVIRDTGSGVKVIGNGYTSFFAEKEFLVTTNNVTLDAGTAMPFTITLDNGETDTVTTSSITLNAPPGSKYRVYLERGSIVSSDTASGTLVLEGKIDIAVEGENTASWNGYSNIKYVSFEGKLTVRTTPNGYAPIDEDKKSNLLVSITDSKGRLVKQLVVKDPYRQYYVRDGVYLTFSSGQIKSGDSFQVKVGAGITENVGELDEAYQQVLRRRTEVGARMEAVKMARNRYQIYKQKTVEAKAPLEDADLAEATMELQKAQMALRSALMASVRLFTPTLLDFLR